MAEDNEVNDHEMSEEKNGEAMETDSKSKELADYGLNESVVTKLEELFTTGIINVYIVYKVFIYVYRIDVAVMDSFQGSV